MRAASRVGSETALAAVGLALLAALVYGDHVVRGGFLWDDWENAGTSRFGGGDGFLGPFDLRQVAYRPVLQLLMPLPHVVFGAHPALHLALALLLAVGACAAFHALLRAAGAPRQFAMAAAALALLFPWSSSTRLWATASLNLVAVILVFAAGAVSLRVLAHDPDAGARRRVALTAAMCAAAVLTYEAVAGLVLLLPALYRLHAPWRVALRRWRAEAVAAGVASAWVAVATTKPESGGAAALEHALAIARQGASLTGRALVPLDAVPAAAGLAAGAVIVASALATRRRAARRTATAAGLSLAALVLAWAPFAPGQGKYAPGAPGIYDRVNIVAAFALAALVCSVAAAAGTLLPPRIRRAAVAGLLALVAAGWTVAARHDVSDYDRAAAAQRAELRAVEAALGPRPAHGTAVLLLHDRAWAAPGVPTFGRPWDLGPALRLHYGDASLAGVPLTSAARIGCGARALWIDAPGDPPPIPYARAVVVDARADRSTLMASARDCDAVVRALRPRRASA